MRILVIGSGASGLVTAKTLRQRGHEVCICEAASKIGGTFENKSYENARMVSSKYLTCFSDFRRPSAETHMSLEDYVVYLQEYVAHFKMDGIIRLGTQVRTVERAEEGYWVTCGSEQREHWDAVAVCSGLHNVPRVPHFDGEEEYRGTVIHSASYKTADIFSGKRVLVIGSGETGFDMAYAAATSGADSVTMSTRHGFVSVPADFGEGKPPLDCIIMNWATHHWESAWAQRVGMHWWITTKITRCMFKLLTGSSWGFNQWVGRRYNMTLAEGRKHIVNKSVKCMPLLNRAAKRRAPRWQQFLYSWWDDVPGQDVDLVEGSVSKMTQNAVHFHTEGGERVVEADLVVLATGYRQQFPFLCPDEDAPLPQKHFIVNESEPTLAYIGFVRPNVGAIPPMSEMQAMWWCAMLEKKLVESVPDYYKLAESRLSYGVDYGSYMFALAQELGSVPGLWYWLWRNPIIAITCALGQAHVPLFRLQGPFRDSEAEATCAGELFSVILKRREMNLIFVLEGAALAVLNAVTTPLGFCLASALAFQLQGVADRTAFATFWRTLGAGRTIV